MPEKHTQSQAVATNRVRFCSGVMIGVCIGSPAGFIYDHVSISSADHRCPGAADGPFVEETIHSFHTETLRERMFLAELRRQRSEKLLIIEQLHRCGGESRPAVLRLRKELTSIENGIKESESKLESLNDKRSLLAEVRDREAYNPREMDFEPQIDANRILLEHGSPNQIDLNIELDAEFDADGRPQFPDQSHAKL